MAFFRIAPLALAVLWLALAPAGPAAADYLGPNMSDPAYTSCQTDDECKVVTSACSAPIAVNQKHYDQVDVWFKHVSLEAHCIDGLSIPEVKKEACIKNRCTLELEQAPPQKADESPQAKDPTYCDKDDECAVVLGDCCVKSFVNTKNAARMQAEIKFNSALATCFFPDRRHVVNLRCEKHKCTADLQVPNELPDPTHSTKNHCEQ